MEKEIDHFSHTHYLILDQDKRKEGDQMTCNGCTNKISADFYGCTPCKHYVCKSCVGLAPKIRHPFHREHPLTLFPQSPYKRATDSASCDVCGMECDGFVFHCSKCKFNLHVNCATLMPTTNNYKASEQQTRHVYKGSEHPLIPCYRKNKQLDFLCSVCDQHIKGTIYVCLDCRAIMDESCIQLPQQITHHLHPDHHTLTFTSSCVICEACGAFKDRFCYSCSECPFRLDVRCASLMPKAIIENYDDQSLENHQVVQASFTHPDDWIPCDNTKGIFSFSCSACGLCIEGTVYVCLYFNFLLHKSCAELPRQIKHPFHPPHPLVLHYKNFSVNSSNSSAVSYRCKACKCSGLGFKYRCGECDFEMDVTCASLTYSTLKFEIHKHPLAIFNDPTFTKRKTDSSVNCNICENFTSFPFFRCVPCDFSIKLCCFSILPYTFKHSNHRHSLTLTYSFIKDHLDNDFDSEYYCDVCEEMRELPEPTYYCEDCHCVAHTGCVFHEILPLLGREWPLVLKEEIVMLQAKVDAVIMKIKSLTIKLTELEKEIDRQPPRIVTDIFGSILGGARAKKAKTELERQHKMIQAEVVSLRKKLGTLKRETSALH
ncbi:uncharacterized protein LOC132303525 [Cornus florida]|uniref:uncharacterized protein LOC132303525 n=1 Tax=Cornus florida TaxID=4283 RepID=UPI00289E72CE|nr:uncharacterized protein LOC132303525 [Cornus florida]XP_059656798.1 uncharacterized protein LOC132303525 [Cornus florida]XP_059656800.1 uncharacterized protein LOC132303525 [Cornus florida]XP_059656801.1 uncharacterized protein LOC132303525 [Cornus florida]